MLDLPRNSSFILSGRQETPFHSALYLRDIHLACASLLTVLSVASVSAPQRSATRNDPACVSAVFPLERKKGEEGAGWPPFLVS